jgi:hypothetical protein
MYYHYGSFVKSPICSLFVISAPYQVRDKLQQESVISGCYGLPLPDQVEDRFRGSDSIFDFLREHQLLKPYKLKFYN